MGNMKKIIQKPVNWQDFEDLCKKLWGEIWNCPSIKKNGRSGQVQHGVDIYGIPDGEKAFFGIQCKGKDDYSQAELTETEIITEIEKAKNFQPPLKQLIFATTANKDVKIEEFIRRKSIESINAGSFYIDIYSWEDIADLIEENLKTYNWYVNEVRHKINHDISILFENWSDTITQTPTFNRNIIKIDKNFIKKSIPISTEENFKLLNLSMANLNKRKINNSYIKVVIIIYNSGSTALEEYKLRLEIEENYQDISEENTEGGFSPLIILLSKNICVFSRFRLVLFA